MKLPCIIGNMHCWGCCGDNFKSKEEIKKAIDKNTIEYKHSKNLKEFSNRNPETRSAGICRSIIWKNKKAVCISHPGMNKGIDYRDFKCDKSYLCETARKWIKWNNKEKEDFVNYILKKNLNWYEFSIKMDNGELLIDFLLHSRK